MNKRLVSIVLKYLVAFGLLAWVIHSNWAPANGTGLKDTWNKHAIKGQPIHVQFLLLGVVIYTASVLLMLARWFLLVQAQDLLFRFSDALRLGLIGIFFNTFLPGAIGGDVIRAAFLAREQRRRSVAVATVLMDRVIALWALMCFVALLGGTFWVAGMLEGLGEGKAKLIVETAGASVAVTATVWVGFGFLSSQRAELFAVRLSRLPRVGGPLAELWRAVWFCRLRPGSIALTVVLSWISHVGFVVSFYCFARTLWDGNNAIPTLTEHFLLVPLGAVIQALPLFPGGVGIGEASFGGLYAWFAGAAAKANGVLGSLVQRVCRWVFGLAGFFVYHRMRPSFRRAEQPAVPVVATPVWVPRYALMEPDC